MLNLIEIAKEFVRYYVSENKDEIKDIQEDVVFNDAFLYKFVVYLHNPNNGYRSLIDWKFNNNIKSYYVRYCNKRNKMNYGEDSCIKYNISLCKLLYHIAQTVANEEYEYIEKSIFNK